MARAEPGALTISRWSPHLHGHQSSENIKLCAGAPCVSLGILLLILRDLLRYLWLSWVRGSMSRLLSLFIPFSQFIFHVSELRAVCKVYSREKILLRIQVTIIIHAKQIKLPNRPLWAITYIDSDWRIKHSQRFLVSFKRLPCLVRTENTRSFLTVEFICLRER